MDLALKYRPHIWQDVVGQPTVISILSRQVATKSWKNAYLFCGCHGSGKTTTARIFADAVNNGQGQPIEIDAASNNGVDNIRALIADAQQSAIDCDYKFYILDEAHQLTRAAWDAALKLIEEPPLNSIFIFCTTNPEKIPDTILSRVQRFDFLRVQSDIIANRLEYIMNEELHSNYERVALDRIASIAEGHVRDAIHLLGKCLDVSENITLDIVEATLGLVKYDSLAEIMSCLFKHNLEGALSEFTKLKAYNTDMSRVYDEITSIAIDCAIYAQTENLSYTNIPETYKVPLRGNKQITAFIVNRLMEFRKYLNSGNAETFLKTIFIEVCKE